jgi:hypothetical protein
MSVNLDEIMITSEFEELYEPRTLVERTLVEMMVAASLRMKTLSRIAPDKRDHHWFRNFKQNSDSLRSSEKLLVQWQKSEFGSKFKGSKDVPRSVKDLFPTPKNPSRKDKKLPDHLKGWPSRN